MPWRPRYLSTRRHPVAIGLYLVLLLLGVFFLTGLLDSRSITGVLGGAWRTAWDLQLLAGGALTLAGVIWPWNSDEASGLEQTGAFLGATGLLTFTAAIVQVAGWSSPAWVIYGVLAAALLCRVLQIWWVKRRTAQIVQRLREDDR